MFNIPFGHNELLRQSTRVNVTSLIIVAHCIVTLYAIPTRVATYVMMYKDPIPFLEFFYIFTNLDNSSCRFMSRTSFGRTRAGGVGVKFASRQTSLERPPVAPAARATARRRAAAGDPLTPGGRHRSARPGGGCDFDGSGHDKETGHRRPAFHWKRDRPFVVRRVRQRRLRQHIPAPAHGQQPPMATSADPG